MSQSQRKPRRQAVQQGSRKPSSQRQPLSKKKFNYNLSVKNITTLSNIQNLIIIVSRYDTYIDRRTKKLTQYTKLYDFLQEKNIDTNKQLQYSSSDSIYTADKNIKIIEKNNVSKLFNGTISIYILDSSKNDIQRTIEIYQKQKYTPKSNTNATFYYNDQTSFIESILSYNTVNTSKKSSVRPHNRQSKLIQLQNSILPSLHDSIKNTIQIKNREIQDNEGVWDDSIIYNISLYSDQYEYDFTRLVKERKDIISTISKLQRNSNYTPDYKNQKVIFTVTPATTYTLIFTKLQKKSIDIFEHDKPSIIISHTTSPEIQDKQFYNYTIYSTKYKTNENTLSILYSSTNRPSSILEHSFPEIYIPKNSPYYSKITFSNSTTKEPKKIHHNSTFQYIEYKGNSSGTSGLSLPSPSPPQQPGSSSQQQAQQAQQPQQAQQAQQAV